MRDVVVGVGDAMIDERTVLVYYEKRMMMIWVMRYA